MNTALAETILYVTGKHGLENATQQELQDMVAKYPYFAPAQLVYAAKLKLDNSFKLQTQVQKTGLFLNNYKWLQFQLLDAGTASAFQTTVSQPTVQPLIVEQTIAANVSEPVANNIVHPTSEVAESVEQIAIVETPSDISNIKTAQKPIEENLAELNSPLGNINLQQEERPKDAFISTPEIVDETISTNHLIPGIAIPSIEEVKGMMDSINETKDLIAAQAHTPIMASIEPIVEETLAINNTRGVETNSQHFETTNGIDIAESLTPAIEATNNFEIENTTTPVAETIANNSNDIHAQIAALKANWHKMKDEQAAYEETVNEYSNSNNSDTDLLVAPSKIETELASVKNDWNTPLTETAANTPLPFETEPYYTIDYFASQGIKFDYSKEPQDKLTTKMLKFTDWLKKMKGQKMETVVEDDPELEQTIQNIAQNSNESKEVVTETMADIFAKQGKTEKAIQLYIKLSFLIPAKSTFFAAKIKELKGI